MYTPAAELVRRDPATSLSGRSDVVEPRIRDPLAKRIDWSPSAREIVRLASKHVRRSAGPSVWHNDDDVACDKPRCTVVQADLSFSTYGMMSV